MKILKGEAVSVSLEGVEESPGPYAMSFGFDLKGLIRSIERIGVVNSPLIDRDEEGRIRIVAGYRRILALKGLRREEALCIDLSASRLTAVEKLHLNLYDNLATREFNEVEKGMILEALSRHHGKEEILSFHMPLLGLPAHESQLKIFLSLGGLEEEIRLALARKRVSFKTVQSLMEMSPESRSVVFKWLSSLSFTFSQQIQFLAFIDDISCNDDKGIPDLLSRTDLVAILDNQGLNRPQKAKSVLERLRVMRYPSLSLAEKAFRIAAKDLKLPNGVEVRHPPYFEGPGYSLQISFRDGRELRRKLIELSSMKGLENLGDPWKSDHE
ncbi:MAG: ParB/RepB/Spo0J family partition protein [Deltaproteobacteria bacterium]|nr:ParB/RepB/Spo0J family partition protein [Deltaproteobacteria bacterium]